MNKPVSNILVIATLAIALLVSGCQNKTQYGECIGIQEPENTHLVYKPSVVNIVLGVIFIETIFAPIIWLACDFNCPVGTK